MKKLILSLSGSFLFAISYADEGMWLPLLLKQLNEPTMKSLGMRMSAEDVYSINKSSLKDAVLQFGNGCTGEVISDQGLVLTNHHCGFGNIQSHSTIEHNYLKDGFWAKSLGEELPCKDLTVTFIVQIEDVTKKVLEGSATLKTEEERIKLTDENIKKIVADAEKVNGNLKYFIRPFFYGAEFYMFTTQVFKDVRLVGAPPSSIGKFGGDTDNWMWPRHTGDFSMFRIYANDKNEPAEYDANNKPFKPKRSIKVNLNGVKEGDFTLTYGFPGRTYEYLTSYGIEQVVKVSNPIKIKLRGVRLGIWDQDMKADEAIRIKYASKHANIANYYKKFIGENKGIRLFDGLAKKKEFESKFQSWSLTHPIYGTVISDLKGVYEKANPVQFVSDITNEGFLFVEANKFAQSFMDLIESGKAGKQEEFDKELKKLKPRVETFFKDYNAATDKKMFPAMFKLYNENLPAEFTSEVVKDFRQNYGSTLLTTNYDKFTNDVFGKSWLTDKTKVEEFLKTVTPANCAAIEQDPLFTFTAGVMNHYNKTVKVELQKYNDQINLLERTYVEGMRAMDLKKSFYPDANSTMRVAYGKVQGFKPYDGAKYDYISTLEGIIEKMDSTSDEFNVPKKLVDLYNKKDYGRYEVNGTVPVAFCATNHTTGGNSGSPLFDADGNLIGLNFDTNWEGTMSNYIVNPATVRNICVDIRYVMFIIDKFAGASNLISEIQVAPIHAKQAVAPKSNKAKAKS